MRFKFFSITIFAVLLISLMLPRIASAGIVPCGTSEHPEKCNLCHVFKLLQAIINGASVILLALAAIFIVIGGIVILSSAGSPDRISQGKKTITYSIIGIVICFGAWIIINTVMSALVNPGKMPWNKIECKTTGGEKETHKECANSVCKDVNGAGTNQCNTDAECASGDRKYCVCEMPVYDLDPNSFPSEASIIGTNAKITSTLSSQQECLQKCVAANASTYCRTSLKPYTALYCTTDTELKNKSACTLNVLTADCQISTQWFPKTNSSLTTCIDNSSCIDLVTPGSSVYNSTLAKRCWLDGQLLCRCESKGTGTSPCQLYRYMKEYSPGGTSLWDCNNASPYYCRLDCKYDKCEVEKTNWCDEVKDSFSCFGSFTCKNMITSQEGDACDQLKKFLNCMGSKNMPAGAKEISSISDNSKYKCFGTSYWNSKGQCSGTTDSCTGTCCAHIKYSLHYGGKPPGEGGVVGCRTCSWAIDFANEQYYQGIKNVAEVCADELNYGKVDVIEEGNHVHVELDEVAKTLRCQ